MTQIVVTFDCQRCGAGHELNLGTGAITLRDGAGGSVDPPEADAADATVTPPAPTTRRPAPRKPLTRDQLGHRVMRHLATATTPQTRNAIAQGIGVTKGSRAYAEGIPGVLALALAAKLVVPDGTVRGHPAYRITVEGRAHRTAQAYPAAAVANDTSPPAAADTSPGAAAPGDGSRSRSDASPAPGATDASPRSERRAAEERQLQARTSLARQTADQRRAERTEAVLAYLDQHGEATIQDIAAGLGMQVSSLTSLRVDLERRHVISWRRAKPGTEHPMYFRVPLGNEAEGVDCSQHDPQENGTLQGRVMAQLLTGAKNVPELASALDAHPALIAQAVSKLQREGEVVKQPGGRYLRTAL